MRTPHPRIDIVASCRSRPTLDGELVERVGLRDDADFWGHYIVGPDGRQEWQADYDSLATAVAGAREAGSRRLLLDDGGRLIRAS
jgi:hypothetical protein